MQPVCIFVMKDNYLVGENKHVGHGWTCAQKHDTMSGPVKECWGMLMQAVLQVPSYAPRSRRERRADRVSSSLVEEARKGSVAVYLQHGWSERAEGSTVKEPRCVSAGKSGDLSSAQTKINREKEANWKIMKISIWHNGNKWTVTRKVFSQLWQMNN